MLTKKKVSKKATIKEETVVPLTEKDVERFNKDLNKLCVKYGVILNIETDPANARLSIKRKE